MERGYPQNCINNTLLEVKFQERTQALSNETKKDRNVALRNTIPTSSYRSQRNLNVEVVPNTATTITKTKFSNRKGAFTQTYS